MISTIVSLAIQLWLRSQVEHSEDLQVKVTGGDRQILSGYAPRVMISARNVIYQGLHLSQIHLAGKGIRVNLGQVLRGKPFQLLESIPVQVDLVLQEVDLNASLQTPLLATALAEILVTLLQAGGLTDVIAGPDKQSINLRDPKIFIDTDQLTLETTLMPASGNPISAAIRAGLQLENDHVLRLGCPQWLPHIKAKRGFPLEDLEDFKLDLGPEVALQELTLRPGQITCHGCITVVPA
jgi:hypothetical protein